MDENVDLKDVETQVRKMIRELGGTGIRAMLKDDEQETVVVPLIQQHHPSDHFPSDEGVVKSIENDNEDAKKRGDQEDAEDTPNEAHQDVDGGGENDSNSSRSTSRSWYSDEPPPLCLNYDAIKHMATQFIPGSHGKCFDLTVVRRGTFHEIRELRFEDGWSCIARFTREEERLEKTESELATIEYVRKHTSIPVPEIFLVNYNENHVVGAPFVFMEKIRGMKMFDVWDGLSTEHKLSIIAQTAGIVGQLAGLHFDQIGSLTGDGTVGPLLNISRELFDGLEGPFSTTIDYFFACLNEKRLHRPKVAMAYYPEIRRAMETWLEKHDEPTLNGPYRLIHNDLNTWNIMVDHTDEDAPPKITGVIDWDWAFTGPSYYLFEYPPSLIECKNWEDDEHELKLLRKHFVKVLSQRYPKGSAERANVKRCFKEKTDTLNRFPRVFCDYGFETDELTYNCTRGYLKTITRTYDESYVYHPYGGCSDYEPDSDPESDDE